MTSNVSKFWRDRRVRCKGRNSNAGIVKIDSVKPSADQDSYISASYGQCDTFATEAAFGGQFSDSVTARLALKYQRRSDWIDNTTADTSGDDIDVKAWDFGNGAQDIATRKTESLAAFGQVEYAVSDRLAVTAGLRYTTDDKKLEVKPGPNSFSPADSISVDDSYLSWDLAFTYDMSDEWS